MKPIYDRNSSLSKFLLVSWEAAGLIGEITNIHQQAHLVGYGLGIPAIRFDTNPDI